MNTELLQMAPPTHQLLPCDWFPCACRMTDPDAHCLFLAGEEQVHIRLTRAAKRDETIQLQRKRPISPDAKS